MAPCALQPPHPYLLLRFAQEKELLFFGTLYPGRRPQTRFAAGHYLSSLQDFSWRVREGFWRTHSVFRALVRVRECPVFQQFQQPHPAEEYGEEKQHQEQNHDNAT